MGRTKILVFQMKELIYTGLFVILGVTIVILLFVLFGGKKQTPTTESQAKIYNPGTYSLELTLNDTLLNMEVVVDSDRVKSVSLKNIDDSVTTMFPLLTPSLANIEKQLVNETDPENVILSDDSRYTEMMLLESVKEVLKKARV